jgi:hypothetical protein
MVSAGVRGCTVDNYFRAHTKGLCFKSTPATKKSFLPTTSANPATIRICSSGDGFQIWMVKEHLHEDQSMHEMEMSAIGLHFQDGPHAFARLLMVT